MKGKCRRRHAEPLSNHPGIDTSRPCLHQQAEDRKTGFMPQGPKAFGSG